MRRSAEYVVIGAGIIGSVITYFLAREGADVALLDRGGVCAGSSGATHTQIGMHNRMPGLGLELTLATIDLFHRLDDELDCDFEFRETGNLMLIDNEEQLEWAAERCKVQAGVGVRSTLLTRDDLDECEPHLGPRVIAAYLYPQSIRLNSMRLCHALTDRARRLGAGIHLYSPATGIDVYRGRVRRVRTPDGDIAAANVICAAGPWSTAVGAMAGVDIPLVLNKGHVIITEKTADLGVRMKGEVILHDAAGRPVGSTDGSELETRYAVRFVFSQTDHGNCLIGRSGEEFPTPADRDTHPDVLRALIRRACRFMPMLADLNCIRSFAGFRPYSPDHEPLLGPSGEVEGFYVAAGHGDRGVGYCCTGKLLVDYLAGKEGFMPLERLAFNRMEAGRPSAAADPGGAGSGLR